MFKVIKVFLLFVVLISCSTTETADTSMMNMEANPDEVYVCYNTDSDQHGKPCSKECLSDTNSFCWLLKREFCLGELVYEWQKSNCHLFD